MKSIYRCTVASVCLACAAPCLAWVNCDRCARCGCAADCCPVCRPVPSTKKVTKIRFECECEHFCVPGKSDHCVEFDACGHKKHVYTPTCAQVRTRKKLVKKETVTEVPATQWVVENLCGDCAVKCAAADGQRGLTDAANLHAGGTLASPQPGLSARNPVDDAEASGQPAARGLRLKADLGRALPALFSRE